MLIYWFSEGVSGLCTQTFSQAVSSGISTLPVLTPARVNQGRVLGLVLSLCVGLAGLVGSQRVVRWLWGSAATPPRCAAGSAAPRVRSCETPGVVLGLW
jgi:hypothetical protein